MTMNEDLKYDPESGEIIWIKWNRVAGTKHHDGYIQIRYKNKLYGAHRIAWFLYYGKWPTLIDHINGDRSDNRISNLREATKRQNAQNSIQSKPYKGVTWAKTSNKWRARIVIDGTELHLGVFETIEEAHQAYVNAANQYFGAFANDGIMR